MGVELTSIEAYQTIRDNGLLSKRRWQVYDFIYRNQPCTLNAIIQGLARTGQNTGAISGRISELRRLSVIEPCGDQVAPTGHRVLLWRTTRGLPKKIVDDMVPCPNCLGKGKVHKPIEAGVISAEELVSA